MTDGNHMAYPNAIAGGLTKRELFAAMMMQGLIRVADDAPSAREAVSMADELIEALNEENQ